MGVNIFQRLVFIGNDNGWQGGIYVLNAFFQQANNFIGGAAAQVFIAADNDFVKMLC